MQEVGVVRGKGESFLECVVCREIDAYFGIGKSEEVPCGDVVIVQGESIVDAVEKQQYDFIIP